MAQAFGLCVFGYFGFVFGFFFVIDIFMLVMLLLGEDGV